MADLGVIEQQEPQSTLSDDEEVVAELSDGMKLIESANEWIVRPGPDSGKRERHYQSERDARLFFGLWLESDGWSDAYPTSGTQQVPIEIVATGRDAVAAYLRCGTGTLNSRSGVARMLEVSEQTVSNYWNRVRYSE